MKQNNSMGNLIEYHNEGWKFTIKNVKGKKYITIRRSKEVRSLGPYSEELWRLIGEVENINSKKTEGHPNLEITHTDELDATEAIIGIRIIKAIKGFGVDPSDALGFIDSVKEALNQNLTPETFVKIVNGMREMKVETRADYLALENEGREKSIRVESLRKQVFEHESKLNSLSKSNEAAEKKLGETSKVLESKIGLAGKVKEAEDLGLGAPQLTTIVETTQRIGARLGLGIDESINWLVNDLIENWGPKMSFENEKIRLLAELDLLNKKIELAEDNEEITQEKVRAEEEALSGLEELKKHVSVAEIIEFKQLLTSGGFNVSSFRSEVKRLGSVTASVDSAIQDSYSELARLQQQITFLSLQVSNLTSSKTELETRIYTLNSEAIKGIVEASKEIGAVAEGLKLDFEAPKTGYKASIQSLRKDTLTELKNFLDASTSEVEDLRKNTWEVGKHIGFNVHLVRLARIIAGEPVGKVEALSTMKMTADGFADYAKRNHFAERCPSLTTLSDELRGIIV